MKPAYVLIMDYIKAKILSKELRPGDKVPSENELARIFNVSRLTARKALENLEYSGIVTRIQGLGTFVASVHEQLKGVRIGVLITNYQDTRASMLFGIVRTFQKFSIDVIPFNLDALFTNTIHEERMLRELLKLEIKGLIIEPRISSLSDTLLLGLINENFPVVFVDRTIEGFPKVPVVYSDNRNGGQLVGKHMKKHHVKSALFVTEEPFDVSSVKERFAGLKDEVAEITWKMITDFDKDFQSAVKTVQKEGLEAVFFCNDYLAIRGITYLKEYGYKIPADISVYGFDDLRVSLYAYPRLTTVHQDFQAMGELAALLLVKIFLGEPLEFEERVPVNLMVRESCGCNKL